MTVGFALFSCMILFSWSGVLYSIWIDRHYKYGCECMVWYVLMILLKFKFMLVCRCLVIFCAWSLGVYLNFSIRNSKFKLRHLGCHVDYVRCRSVHVDLCCAVFSFQLIKTARAFFEFETYDKNMFFIFLFFLFFAFLFTPTSSWVWAS